MKDGQRFYEGYEILTTALGEPAGQIKPSLTAKEIAAQIKGGKVRVYESDQGLVIEEGRGQVQTIFEKGQWLLPQFAAMKRKYRRAMKMAAA